MPRRRLAPAIPTNPVTETDAFRRWFGNSQVVDDRGQPLVVYHGTPDARGIYLPEVSRNGLPGFQPGIWRKPTSFYASDSPRVARTYADHTRAWDYQKAEPMVIPLYLRIVNPMVIDARGVKWTNTEGHVARAHQAGHDGLIIRNSLDDYQHTKHSKPSTVYVWFEPSQAKSAATTTAFSMVDRQPLVWATPNDGSFDMQDPDIRSNRSYRRNPTSEPVRRAVLVAPFLRVPNPFPDQVFHLFYVEGGLVDHRGQLQEWIVSSSVLADPEDRRPYSSTVLFAARPDGTWEPHRAQIESPVERTMNVRKVFESLGVVFQDRLMAPTVAPTAAPTQKRGWDFWSRGNPNPRRNNNPRKRAVLVAPFLRVTDPFPDQVFHLFHVEGGLLDQGGQFPEWIVSSTVPPDLADRRPYPSTMLFAARPDGTWEPRSAQIQNGIDQTTNVREVFENLGVLFQDRLMAQPDESRIAPRQPWHRRMFGT